MKARVVFLVFLIMISFCLVNTQPIEAQSSGDIYIRSDGSVDPSTAPIQRVGDVYTFTDNIFGSIIVERDNIVVDGGGFSLQPQPDAITGVDLRDINNVTVRNIIIKGFLGSCGILLINSNDCTIYQNNITNNFKGIEMTSSSSRNRIAENHVQNNSVGMEMYSSNPGSDNTISENKVLNNHFGMQIKDFINTDILGNNVTSNTWGLGLGVGSGSTARNNIMNNNTYGFRAFNVQAFNVDVDTSNTVNGRPIYYWVNQHDKTVPADACYVALIGCSGITIKNLNLNGNFEGVFLGSTTNSIITSNRISNNLNGITFDASSKNTVSGNTITKNEQGISIRWSSNNNSIHANDITANTDTDIYIAESASNTMIENNITNSEKGVHTEYCGINTFHHNNFVNNSKQWDDIGFTPWPIPLPISISIWDDGKEGNYWSDYTGEDANDDGIGDTPHLIGTNNTDRYPLMKPYTIIPPSNGAQQSETFPTTWIIAATALIIIVGVLAFLVYFGKIKKSVKTEKMTPEAEM
jgi:parallel beta-helix repeat protein